MFDITSSKLLLLGIVALLVIGPKDFPALLRTIGKYVGIIRGHAREFRAQFDEAMRESELADLKKDVENIARETEASLQATERSVEQSLDEARRSMDAPAETTPKPDALTHEASDPPSVQQQVPAFESTSAGALNGSGHPATEEAGTPANEGQQSSAEPTRPSEKSGA